MKGISYKQTYHLILILLTIFNTYCAYGAQFPATLSDDNTFDNTLNTATTNVTLKTPEYIILRANEESTFSSETSGKVIYLPIKEGSSFKKGEVLLRLDCKLQLAELKKAIAQQTSALKALQSAKKLKTYGAISELEFVKTKADADAADAESDKLHAIVEKCTIVAPFTGGVTEIKVHLYETVKPGDPLLKVTNIKDLAIEVQIPSKWLAWLHVGSTFKVYVNDINQTLQSEVNYINPAVEPVSQTVKISGKILSPPNNLKPGMTGQAFFVDNPESNKGYDQ